MFYRPIGPNRHTEKNLPNNREYTYSSGIYGTFYKGDHTLDQKTSLNFKRQKAYEVSFLVTKEWNLKSINRRKLENSQICAN